MQLLFSVYFKLEWEPLQMHGIIAKHDHFLTAER